ncbi:MAG: hypothetical protein CMJ39_06515 [Phycisphaerae bacterium]|nr:hypothetical protein [Phycisphaerae bacterium]
MSHRSLLIVMVCLPVLASGCIRRTLSITSTPSDALVWVNHREVGRTPVVVEFTHYGTYDVRIEREGMEPVLTSRKAAAPVWDMPGPDLVVEVLPFQANSQLEWHFDLEPRDESLPALVKRARAFRTEASGIESNTETPEDAEVVKMDPDSAPVIESGSPSQESSDNSAGSENPASP